jgi:hypothetical protein
MKHPANRELFAYWNAQRGARPAPERTEIDPTAIRHVLGDTFVLAWAGFGHYPFRLAGTRLCAMFGRELKGENLVALWDECGQAALRELIAVVIEEKAAVVASISGATKDDTFQTVKFELLLLPLAHRSRADARVLGALAPLTAPYWLGAKAMRPLTLGMYRHIDPDIDAVAFPRLTAGAGRQRRGLVVYEGGRRD